jgi:hypothetical protein
VKQVLKQVSSFDALSGRKGDTLTIQRSASSRDPRFGDRRFQMTNASIHELCNSPLLYRPNMYHDSFRYNATVNIIGSMLHVTQCITRESVSRVRMHWRMQIFAITVLL